MSGIDSVVKASIKLSTLLYQYGEGVKNAREDIGPLRSECDLFIKVAEQLRVELDGPHGSSLKASQNLRAGITDASSQLTRLLAKLDPDDAHGPMRRFGKRALTWPFQSHEVKVIVDNLARCRGILSFGLQLDQVYDLSHLPCSFYPLSLPGPRK